MLERVLCYSQTRKTKRLLRPFKRNALLDRYTTLPQQRRFVYQINGFYCLRTINVQQHYSMVWALYYLQLYGAEWA